MKILLPESIVQKLTLALKKADSREIGGILMGEHLSKGVFRVKELTIQEHGGTYFSFVRQLKNILNPLRLFFYKTGYNYKKYNYLGEWHSHPEFTPEPSICDSETMWEIVNDPEMGANFVVLMIVRLNKIEHLEGTVSVYLPKNQRFKGELIREEFDKNISFYLNSH